MVGLANLAMISGTLHDGVIMKLRHIRVCAAIVIYFYNCNKISFTLFPKSLRHSLRTLE